MVHFNHGIGTGYIGNGRNALKFILALFLASNVSAMEQFSAGSDPNKVNKAGDVMTGPLTVYNSSFTVTYGVIAGSGTFSGVVNAASATFTGSGGNQYSLNLSSGLYAPAGTIVGNLVQANTGYITVLYVSSSAFLATSGGNVGIGTNTPNALLHVNGRILTSVPVNTYGLAIGTINQGLYTTGSGRLNVSMATDLSYNVEFSQSEGVILPGGSGTSGPRLFAWNSNTNGAGTTAPDTALQRASAGVIEINNGTAANYRDLSLRSLTSLSSGTFAYGVKAGSATLTDNLTASSGTFTGGSGPTYTLNLSSGIYAPNGTILSNLIQANTGYITVLNVSTVNFIGSYLSMGATTISPTTATFGGAVTATNFIGSGAGLTSISAGAVSITTGQVSGVFGDDKVRITTAALATGVWQPSVLPSTLAYTNAAQTFTALQAMTGGLNVSSINASGPLTISSISTSGDIRIGLATASTFSASGFFTLPAIGTPANARGRLFFDGTNLMINQDGASFVALSTGGSGSGGSTFTGGNVLNTTTFQSSVTMTAVGATQFSLETSSGIKMSGGVLQFPNGTQQNTAFSTNGIVLASPNGSNHRLGVTDDNQTTWTNTTDAAMTDIIITSANGTRHKLGVTDENQTTWTTVP